MSADEILLTRRKVIVTDLAIGDVLVDGGRIAAVSRISRRTKNLAVAKDLRRGMAAIPGRRRTSKPCRTAGTCSKVSAFAGRTEL
jgi:hypothetical protein